VLTFQRGISDKTSAFSLIELLVAISVIGILAALLLPSLARSKQQAQGTYCVNNLKQMNAAWMLYSDDFLQTTVPNVGMLQPEYVTNLNWVVGNVNSPLDQTNSLLLSRSLLGSYTKNTMIYRCPSDPASGRVRSVSINNYMHGKGMMINPNFLNNEKTTDIRQPASSFVFLDESAQTINDGYFVMVLTTNFNSGLSVVDLPANYHGGAGAFSFADGHAQLKKWRGTGGQISYADCIWMILNTTVPASGAWPASQIIQPTKVNSAF
jgi:prepilin-type N-terminal cleavage/methylation domain-containing protein/prepilin-type processing-associated H-X9-DG protein